MKRLFVDVRWTVPVLLALFSVLVVGGSVAAQNDNLIANGNFENLNDKGFAADWLTNRFEKEIDMAVDEDVVFDGDRSLRITGTYHAEDPRGPRGGIRQIIDVTNDPAGTRYRFRAAYRTEGVTKSEAVRVRIYFQDVARGAIRELSDDPLFRVVSSPAASTRLYSNAHFYIDAPTVAEGEWQELDVTFIAPLGTARMFLSMSLWHDTGTLWWDNVSLERVN